MRYEFYDNLSYRRKQAQITHLNWKLGIFDFQKKVPEARQCSSSSCKNYFSVLPGDPKLFCSRSCAAHTNNLLRPRRFKDRCVTCQKPRKRYCWKYCSLKCQADDNYHQYIQRWQENQETGVIGIKTRNLSGYLKRYLWNKFSKKCSRCGWNETHSITGKIPLEINHIDGNSENNKESNLELLCPNCHSLTPNYRNLNKGNGREWRLQYLKNRNLVN